MMEINYIINTYKNIIISLLFLTNIIIKYFNYYKELKI